MSDENDGERNEARRRLRLAEAELMVEFEKIGDGLGQRMGYKSLGGMDAIHRFLIDKYHWTLDYVRRLSVEDLSIVLDGVEKNPATREVRKR